MASRNRNLWFLGNRGQGSTLDRIIQSCPKTCCSWVLPGYRRAPHITLAGCGLVDDTHFDSLRLRTQIEILQQLNLCPFQIEQTQLGSFESAPYISICDNRHLSLIRKTLQNIYQDDPPAIYRPHLTLGFYNGDYALTDLYLHFEDYQAPKTDPLLVDTLSYCTYQTNSIQGEITIEYELHLN